MKIKYVIIVLFLLILTANYLEKHKLEILGFKEATFQGSDELYQVKPLVKVNDKVHSIYLTKYIIPRLNIIGLGYIVSHNEKAVIIPRIYNITQCPICGDDIKNLSNKFRNREFVFNTKKEITLLVTSIVLYILIILIASGLSLKFYKEVKK